MRAQPRYLASRAMSAALMPVLAAALLAASTAGASAEVIHVDVNGGGDYLTIQEGLTASAPFDTVLVAPGVYTGPLNMNLDFGSWNRTLLSEAGPESTSIDLGGSLDDHAVYFDDGQNSTTVLAGFTIENGEAYGVIRCTAGSSPSIVDCVFSDNYGDGGPVLYCDNGSSPSFSECRFENNTSRLMPAGACKGNGLDFTDCVFENNTGANGAGCVFGSNLSFVRCRFVGNSADSGDGGAVDCGGSSSFEDCSFTGNFADDGGAIYSDGTVSALRCTFELNHAKWYGGGLCASGASAVITDCSFVGNSVWEHEFEGYGGGMHGNGSEVAVTECDFFDNSARGRGGALSLYDCNGEVVDCVIAQNTGTIYEWTPKGGGIYTQLPNSDPLLIDHCTVAYNTVQSGTCGGIYCLGNYGPDIERSIIAFSAGDVGLFCNGAQPSVANCCVYGNAGGDSLCGTYASNLFVDPGFCDAATGDFTVAADSPCLPGGNPWGETIGALGDGCPGTGVEEPPIASSLVLRSVGGTPSSWETGVECLMPSEVAHLTVTVHSVSGNTIATLHEGPAESRRVILNWDGRNGRGQQVASGVYFFRARSGGDSASAKVVIVR